MRRIFAIAFFGLAGLLALPPVFAGDPPAGGNPPAVSPEQALRAQLRFNGNVVTAYSARSVRPFVTPPLAPDIPFHYTVEASWIDQDGNRVRRQERVVLQGGSSQLVDFTDGNKNPLPPPQPE